MLPARPLPEYAATALRTHVFGLQPYDPDLFLDTQTAAEAIARTQSSLSAYIAAVFGHDPDTYTTARGLLAPVQEALANVWAYLPDTITARDLEQMVTAACLSTLPDPTAALLEAPCQYPN